MQLASDGDIFRVCYNCREDGHFLEGVPKPLCEALQDVIERIGKDGGWLNTSVGGRNKGGCIPWKCQKPPAPVPVKVTK